MLIDTHTHIYTEEFDTDRADVVARAREAGVAHMLLPNINYASLAPLHDTCCTWPDCCHPLIGLHPEDVREDYATVLAKMKESLIEQTPRLPVRFIGIGEVGLDFYWDVTYKSEQLHAFEIQLGWAAELKLPVVIHQRAAFDELYAIMESFRSETLTGIFHCFGGTAEEAKKLLSFPGFMLGIGGIVTYKKSTLPDVLRASVPLDRIVVETDAPYLAPVPHRGQRNEPAFVVEVVRRLADIYGCTPDDVAARTTANAQRLFPTLRILAQENSRTGGRH